MMNGPPRAPAPETSAVSPCPGPPWLQATRALPRTVYYYSAVPLAFLHAVSPSLGVGVQDHRGYQQPGLGYPALLCSNIQLLLACETAMAFLHVIKLCGHKLWPIE